MSDFFELFQRSAQRIETLPFYGPDAEAFQTFQEGRQPTAAQEAPRQRWRANVTAATQDGRLVRRILVVTQPLTPYWRWRLDRAVVSVAAGEDIRVADRTEHPELAALDRDFWLLDGQVALLMDYGPDGQYLGREETRDPDAVARCQAELDLALRYAFDLSEYLQRTR